MILSFANLYKILKQDALKYLYDVSTEKRPPVPG